MFESEIKNIISQTTERFNLDEYNVKLSKLVITENGEILNVDDNVVKNEKIALYIVIQISSSYNCDLIFSKKNFSETNGENDNTTTISLTDPFFKEEHFYFAFPPSLMKFSTQNFNVNNFFLFLFF